MGRFTKPIGYIEQRGRWVIKKVKAYGKKYIVYEGQCFWRFATIRQAREFVFGRINLTSVNDYGSALQS